MDGQDYRRNMPEGAEKAIIWALQEWDFSWDGLAQLLLKYFPNDTEDFFWTLQQRINQVEE